MDQADQKLIFASYLANLEENNQRRVAYSVTEVHTPTFSARRQHDSDGLQTHLPSPYIAKPLSATSRSTIRKQTHSHCVPRPDQRLNKTRPLSSPIEMQRRPRNSLLERSERSSIIPMQVQKQGKSTIIETQKMSGPNPMKMQRSLPEDAKQHRKSGTDKSSGRGCRSAPAISYRKAPLCNSHQNQKYTESTEAKTSTDVPTYKVLLTAPSYRTSLPGGAINMPTDKLPSRSSISKTPQVASKKIPERPTIKLLLNEQRCNTNITASPGTSSGRSTTSSGKPTGALTCQFPSNISSFKTSPNSHRYRSQDPRVRHISTNVVPREARAPLVKEFSEIEWQSSPASSILSCNIKETPNAAQALENDTADDKVSSDTISLEHRTSYTRFYGLPSFERPFDPNIMRPIDKVYDPFWRKAPSPSSMKQLLPKHWSPSANPSVSESHKDPPEIQNVKTSPSITKRESQTGIPEVKIIPSTPLPSDSDVPSSKSSMDDCKISSDLHSIKASTENDDGKTTLDSKPPLIDYDKLPGTVRYMTPSILRTHRQSLSTFTGSPKCIEITPSDSNCSEFKSHSDVPDWETPSWVSDYKTPLATSKSPPGTSGCKTPLARSKSPSGIPNYEMQALATLKTPPGMLDGQTPLATSSITHSSSFEHCFSVQSWEKISGTTPDNCNMPANGDKPNPRVHICSASHKSPLTEPCQKLGVSLSEFDCYFEGENKGQAVNGDSKPGVVPVVPYDDLCSTDGPPTVTIGSIPDTLPHAWPPASNSDTDLHMVEIFSQHSASASSSCTLSIASDIDPILLDADAVTPTPTVTVLHDDSSTCISLDSQRLSSTPRMMVSTNVDTGHGSAQEPESFNKA